MKVKIAQVFGLPPNHFLKSAVDDVIEEKIETDAKTSEMTKKKDVIEDINKNSKDVDLIYKEKKYENKIIVYLC